jgi:hypothetical protein
MNAVIAAGIGTLSRELARAHCEMLGSVVTSLFQTETNHTAPQPCPPEIYEKPNLPARARTSVGDTGNFINVAPRIGMRRLMQARRARQEPGQKIRAALSSAVP